MTVKAMKSGAVEFLTKPFLDQALLDAIHQALDRDRVARREQSNFTSCEMLRGPQRPRAPGHGPGRLGHAQ